VNRDFTLSDAVPAFVTGCGQNACEGKAADPPK
jgi:hypothetical protein